MLANNHSTKALGCGNTVVLPMPQQVCEAAAQTMPRAGYTFCCTSTGPSHTHSCTVDRGQRFDGGQETQ